VNAAQSAGSAPTALCVSSTAYLATGHPVKHTYTGNFALLPPIQPANPAEPTITTSAGPTVVVGTGMPLTDSATLSGGFNPTGTITFTLTGPGNAVVYTNVVTVNGNGTYTTRMGSNPGDRQTTAEGT